MGSASRRAIPGSRRASSPPHGSLTLESKALTHRTFGCAAAALALSALGSAASAAPPGPSISQTGPAPAGAVYAWAPVSAHNLGAADPRLTDGRFQGMVQTAIEGALHAKGFRRTEAPSNAEILVAYHVGLKTRTETRPARSSVTQPNCAFPGCNVGWGVYGPPQVQMRNVKYEEGTLALDLLDRRTGKLLWRSTSTHRIIQKEPTQSRMNAIVLEMTQSLPAPNRR